MPATVYYVNLERDFFYSFYVVGFGEGGIVGGVWGECFYQIRVFNRILKRTEVTISVVHFTASA